MKHSTVHNEIAPDSFDVARSVRGAMAEEMLTASDLSRTFGGAVSYWTRRMTGHLEFSTRDLELIAWATGRHAAHFMGGSAPAGWSAPVRPTCAVRDSNPEPAGSVTGRKVVRISQHPRYRAVAAI